MTTMKKQPGLPQAIQPRLYSQNVGECGDGAANENVLQEAVALRESGRYQEACKRLMGVLEQEPIQGSALAHLAHVQLLLGQSDKAGETIMKALDIEPESSLVQRNLARVCLRKNKRQNALTAGRKALALDPAHPENQLVLAAALEANGLIDQAIELIEESIITKPDYAEAYAQRALHRYRQGNGAAAVDDARKALAYKPHIPHLWAFIGRIQAKENNFAKAIKALEQSLVYEPKNVDTLALLGELKRQNGMTEASQALLRRAVWLDPEHAVAWGNLGAVLQQSGQTDEARSCYVKALELNPDMPDVANNLGCMYLDIQRGIKALYCFQKAVSLQPDRVAFLCNLSLGLCWADRFEEAERMSRRAVAKDPDHLDAYLALATVLQRGGKKAEALEVLNHAKHRFKECEELFLTMANMCWEWGDLAQAESYARNAMKKETYLPEVCSILSGVCRFKEKEPAFQTLENRLNASIDSLKDRMKGHFALGKMYADIKEYDKAFGHYRKANECRKKFFGKAYSHEEDRHKLKIATSVFNPDFFSTRKDWANKSHRPVFILGMPRSGTTLVEQIIGSHGDLYPGGELPYLKAALYQIKKTMSDQRIMELGKTMIQEDVSKVATIYLNKLSLLTSSHPRVSDKMPHNFELLWLIALAFPNATILHCVRDPLDTCLSNYFQKFSKPHPYKNELRSLGLHYRYYLQLMDHWKKVLPILIYDIRYEELVGAPEKNIEKILNYCGLTPDAACLDFYKSKNAVRTASAYQVRQKIYTDSVKKWKRYEKHLSPLFEALGSK